jgi:hypothetical protein
MAKEDGLWETRPCAQQRVGQSLMKSAAAIASENDATPAAIPGEW